MTSGLQAILEDTDTLIPQADEDIEPDFFSVEALKAEFADWKNRGPSGADDHYYFGKDAFYEKPRGESGQHVLRHVHLVPLSNPEDVSAWNRNWERQSGRRTSDTALVYADGGRFGYLLIAILWEPDAHSVSQMKTKEASELMHTFARIAERFIFDGSVIG